jgi:hypothetical protein
MEDSSDTLEPGPALPFHFDSRKEHLMRPNPKPRIVVERTIQDQRFQRFAVTHGAQDLVLTALIVPIAANWCVR